MEPVGHEHGLGVEDIARLRAAAGPNRSRPVKPVPPGVPDFDADLSQHENGAGGRARLPGAYESGSTPLARSANHGRRAVTRYRSVSGLCA